MIAWLHHWLYEDFWVLIWPNAGAMPLCAIFALLWAWIFRDGLGRRLVRWLHKHHSALVDELETAARKYRGTGDDDTVH